MRFTTLKHPGAGPGFPAEQFAAAGLAFLLATSVWLTGCTEGGAAGGAKADQPASGPKAGGAGSKPTAGSGGGRKGGAQANLPLPVLAATAVQKAVPTGISAVGRVEAYSTVQVKAQAGGILQRVHFKEGQDVKAGDLLFMIDPRPYEATLHKEESNLAKSQVQAKDAEMDVKRYTDLYNSKAVSKDEYDQALTTYEANKAQVLADQAAVEYARLQAEYCVIRSPIDGRTGSLMGYEGNLVQPNGDTPLVVINQIQPIYVSFSIPEKELPAVVRRMQGSQKPKVEATIPGDEKNPVAGELTFLDNQVDPQTGTIRLKATFANGDKRLWPGQYVTADLVLSMQENAVMVPSQAVQTGQTGQYVFVIKPDMSVESRPVTAGATLGADTVVEKGLAAGERVVTDGQLRLTPGATVEIKTELSPAQPGSSRSSGPASEPAKGRSTGG